MNDDLIINSFDELKAALDSTLRNGAVLPESADYLMERFDVLCVDIDNVFLSISVNDIKEEYPNLTLDEALEVRDNANENLCISGGYDDINDVAWGQIKAEVKGVKDIGCVSHGRETCLDELAETYGEDDACHNGDGLCDAGTHAR